MNKLILIVEDDETIQELITGLLDDEGYKAVAGNTVSKSSQLLKEVQFDLIILDYSLPDGTGNEVLDLLTELELKIPVIGVSATAEKFKPQPQLFKILPKPFDINSLLAVVEKCLGEK